MRGNGTGSAAPAGPLVAGVDALAGNREPIRTGEVIALVAAPGPSWVAGYRALRDAGGTALLLDVDTPAPERERWLALAGGGRTLSFGIDGEGRLTGTPHPSPDPDGSPRVLLCTSGTTGAPKVVARTPSSLAAEGRRYAAWAKLVPADRILLPVPPWHAYALGWVHAAWESGAGLAVVPSTALEHCARELAGGATVAALVPSIAGLLTLRKSTALTVFPATPLRLVMVGAGRVTENLDRRFHTAFGIGLAPTYGSTETGALFAGPAGVPEGTVGTPLQGVRARVCGPDGAPLSDGQPGVLHVRVDESRDWHDTGDVAVVTGAGLRLIGRRSRAIRRGERWIAPEEVEQVLTRHPAVVDARLVALPGTAGSTVLEAEVVGVRAGATDVAELRTYLAEQLTSYKVPERVRLVGEIPYGPTGKRLPPRSYALGDVARLVEAAQAYRRSELVFTLLRLGVLDMLAEHPASAAQIAGAAGLDRDVCDLLLRTAEELGLVQVEPPDGAPERGGGAFGTNNAGLLQMEEMLSRGWLTRERLVEVATSGLAERPFDRTAPHPTFLDTYQHAMHSPAAHRRVRLGLSVAGFRSGQRLLEITCGPGRYASQVDHARLLRTGPLSPTTPRPAPPPAPDERFDLVVIANAVHLAGPGSDLAALRMWLAEGGRLLVDDVFLDPKAGVPTTIRLDWLTHGGLAWPTVDTLVAGLVRAGFDVERVLPTGSPPATLVSATRGGEPG